MHNHPRITFKQTQSPNHASQRKFQSSSRRGQVNRMGNHKMLSRKNFRTNSNLHFNDKLAQDEMIAGEDFIVKFQLQLNSNLSLHQVIDNQIIDIETNFSWARKQGIDFIKQFLPDTLKTAVQVSQNNPILTNQTNNSCYSNISRKFKKSITNSFKIFSQIKTNVSKQSITFQFKEKKLKSFILIIHSHSLKFKLSKMKS